MSLRLWRRRNLEKPYGKPHGGRSACAVIDQLERGRERSRRFWVLSEQGRVNRSRFQARQHLQPAAGWLARCGDIRAVEIKGMELAWRDGRLGALGEQRAVGSVHARARPD